MGLLIKNGEIITRIGQNLEVPSGTEIIDAHVHIYLPFMATFAKDTHTTGSQAALIGGTLSIIYTLSIVSANLPKDVMFKVFSGLASSLPDATLEPFITGWRAACWTLAALSVIAAIVALLTPTEARRGRKRATEQ